MNLTYIIKKCQGFGFASSLSDIAFKTLSCKSKLIYLRDKDNHKRPKGAETYNDVKDLESDLDKYDKSQPTLFLVEVGVKAPDKVKTDVEMTEEALKEAMLKIKTDISVDINMKKQFEEALLSMKETPEPFTKTDLNSTFLKYLQDIYPLINDTKLQLTLIRIFTKHGIRTDGMMKEHPIAHEYKEKEITKLSSIFSDIKIDDPFYDKTKAEIEESNANGILREFSATSITKFSGFGDSFAQVDHNKTRAKISDINVLRNHECIHALARNRIVATPRIYDYSKNIEKRCSIQILMHALSQFKKFQIVFIYPNYQYIYRFADSPSRLIEVDSSDGNVVLSVIFRFMCLNFFGMHKTIDSDDLMTKYMM